MYNEGWNFLWYVSASSGWTFLNLQHSVKTDTATMYGYSSNRRLMIGGILDGKHSEEELAGIVHSFRVTSSALSVTDIQTKWFWPIDSQAMPWDYFISMFSDLGVQSETGEFINTMFTIDGHSQTFQNSISATVDPTDGLAMASGETQTINGVGFKIFKINKKF